MNHLTDRLASALRDARTHLNGGSEKPDSAHFMRTFDAATQVLAEYEASKSGLANTTGQQNEVMVDERAAACAILAIEFEGVGYTSVANELRSGKVVGPAEPAVAGVIVALRRNGQTVNKEALKVERDEAFSDGVLLALQILNAAGDFANANYDELLNCADQRKLIDRARAEGMMELSGLDKLIAQRAARAAELREELSARAIAVLVSDKFKDEGWEPPQPDHELLRELIAAGMMVRTDARCGFERMRDAWIKPTRAGIIARRALLENKADQEGQANG